MFPSRCHSESPLLYGCVPPIVLGGYRILLVLFHMPLCVFTLLDVVVELTKKTHALLSGVECVSYFGTSFQFSFFPCIHICGYISDDHKATPSKITTGCVSITHSQKGNFVYKLQGQMGVNNKVRVSRQ